MKVRMNEGYLHRKALAYASRESTATTVETFEAAWRQCEKFHGVNRYDDKEGTQKRCTRCGQYRNIGNFYVASQYADGFDIYCKDCRKVINLTSQMKRAL